MFNVVLDRKRVIIWKKPVTFENMEGFNGDHVIEVLTEKASKPFIAYLKSIGISYIFAGKDDIDLTLALKKLKNFFRIKKIAFCCGSGINGSFYNQNLYDQLYLLLEKIEDYLCLVVLKNVDYINLLKVEIWIIELFI